MRWFNELLYALPMVGMAFDLGRQAFARGWAEINLPTARFSIADTSSANTGVTAGGQGDCGTTCNVFRAVIYQKSYIRTVGTQGPQYWIEVGNDAAFSYNSARVGFWQAPTMGNAFGFIYGVLDTATGNANIMQNPQFVRIRQERSGPTTGNLDGAAYDCVIDAC